MCSARSHLISPGLLISPALSGAALPEAEENLANGHPRPSYRGVENIGAMPSALHQQSAGNELQSSPRGWWVWDRLQPRDVDGGRREQNELIILLAVFRGLVLDWHARLEAEGEGDLMSLFFTTLPGNNPGVPAGMARIGLLSSLMHKIPELLKVSNNQADDAFAQFDWRNYYGPGKQWMSRKILPGAEEAGKTARFLSVLAPLPAELAITDELAQTLGCAIRKDGTPIVRLATFGRLTTIQLRPDGTWSVRRDQK